MDDIDEALNTVETSEDSGEVERALTLLDDAIAETKAAKKEVAKSDPAPVIKLSNEEKIDALIQRSLQKMDEIEKKADEIYDLHYTQIALGKDRTDQSKINLIESQRIKTELVGKTADLVNALAKLESAKAKKMQASATGVAAVITAREAGIDLSELKNMTYTGDK